MSTAVIKSIQVAGATIEVLAAADDGNAYRVQTDGTLASLKAALQQATKKASDIRTKPEITLGMTVDFTPPVVVPVTPDLERAQFFVDYRNRLQEQKRDKLDADLASRFRPEYLGEL